jgi:hypothetical protein
MNSFRRNDDMRAVRDLFNLEWSYMVAQDMTHVGTVPIEALDLVRHPSSIYSRCIYTQLQGSRRESPAIPARPAASRRAVPSPPEWLGAALASGRNRPGSGRSSDTARSRLDLSPCLAGFLQTDIRANDDDRRVMIPEMLQGLF